MRYKGTKITTNAEIPSGKIKQFCELERKERGLLEKAFERMGLTARSCHKILKVARTIADMTTLEIMSFRELFDFDTISSSIFHEAPKRARNSFRLSESSPAKHTVSRMKIS